MPPIKSPDLEHRIQIIQEALAEGGDEEDPQELLQSWANCSTNMNWPAAITSNMKLKSSCRGLGFKEKDFQRPLKEFSGGWLMRVTLAKLLVINPDMLLLDEPTNHLDLESCCGSRTI